MQTVQPRPPIRTPTILAPNILAPNILVNAAKQWGVIMYILAAFVSISMPFTLAASPDLAANLFRQPAPADVMDAVRRLCLHPFRQPRALASPAGTPVLARVRQKKQGRWAFCVFQIPMRARFLKETGDYGCRSAGAWSVFGFMIILRSLLITLGLELMYGTARERRRKPAQNFASFARFAGELCNLSTGGKQRNSQVRSVGSIPM
jgi:hypothetical protein